MRHLPVLMTLCSLLAVKVAFASPNSKPENSLVKPRLLAPEALGQEGRITLTPSFTADGNTIYFAQSECAPIWECPQTLKRSRKVAGVWSTPEPIPLPRGYAAAEPRVDYPEVSHDGKSLLMSWSGQLEEDEYLNQWENFDLYRLDLTTAGATPVKLVGPNLNRVRKGKTGRLRFVDNETAPSVTKDGILYFWSERLGGAGERDVYRAKPDGLGGFLKPELLPSPINSVSRDDGAWIHPSGRLMLMTYSNRGGLGNADIFVTTLKDGTWSSPVNLGPSVNSQSNDFSAKLTPDGTQIVFSSLRGTDDEASAAARIWVTDTDHVPALNAALSAVDLF